MKLAMSSLDIMVCARELKNAIGARVDNVYELDGVFLVRLRSHEGRRDLLLEPGHRVHSTGMKYEISKKPSPYAMLLRKHLANAKLVAIDQPDFERILEFRFSRENGRVLVLELFGSGNLILCDGQLKIIQPYRTEVWRHRVLRRGEKYVYPPKKGADVRGLDVEGLRRALKDAPDVVRALAMNLNIGGSFAEEVCARAAIQKDRRPSELSEHELEAILRSIGNLLTQESAPCVVHEDGKPIDVLPFDFKIHLGKRVKRFATFNEALDEYFNILSVSSAVEKQKENFELELKRLRNRLTEQERHFADFYTKSGEAKRKADFAAIHHAQIDEVLSLLSKIQHAKGWQAAIDALESARKAGETWAGLVGKINASKAKVELTLADQSVALDFRLSAFENASELYKRYKRLAKKAAGAKDALEQTRRELDNLIFVGAPKPKVSIPRKRREPKWFERYRWFISSDGMLVIAGRDVKTNAEVVEKSMEPNDRHLHADIVGAPHVVIKAGGRDIPETTLKEAAEFAAMHSRGWREGLGSLDVYWAMPEQISKRAPSGTYLPKGSYIIEGKRNLLKVPVKAAFGVLVVDGEQVVSCCSLSAIQKHSRVVVELEPGGLKKSDLAREIQAKFKAAGIEASVDEIERALPPGKGRIKR